jgi:hypothetical protein
MKRASVYLHWVTGALLLTSVLMLAACSTGKGHHKTDFENGCSKKVWCMIDRNSTSITMKVGESRLLVIYADQEWNDSEILVRENERYSFEIVCVHHWKDGIVEADPITGWKNNCFRAIGFLFAFLKRSSKAPWYALVGGVGRHEEADFAVRTGIENARTVNECGKLHFYANDMTSRYFNNKGILVLKITREN